MRVFIDFWKLEIENKLSFQIIFVFCLFWVAKQVFSLTNRKLFLVTENKEKKQLPNTP